MKAGFGPLCLFLCICASTWNQETSALASAIRVKNQWKQLEFDYPSEEARQNAIQSGQFLVGKVSPIDIDVYDLGGKNETTFITISRFQPGVPATLGIITNKTYQGNPVIAPYPSWEWNKHPASPAECAENRVVSVFRVKIDECGRLWVLDDGLRICRAQILAFDLKTNQLVHRYEIPENQLQSNSILSTPVIDVRDPPPQGTCQDVFVYVADCQAMAIIVHDVAKRTSWQIIDKTFYPYPNFGTFTIAGESFDLMDGVLGMALSPYKSGADRILYYHAMSSPTENWVRTSDIRNQTRFASDPSPDPSIFHTYRHQRNTQCNSMAIDKDGIAYFGLITDLTLNCWNTAVDYSLLTIGELAYNRETLQFASGMKVINNKSSGKQDLWFMTMRRQKLALGTLNPNETNFRVFTANIRDLTFGSICRLGLG